MADDGFREIQLSGKQLAALFMGAAVVLVVTFLCGVLVGRGVRAQKEPVVAVDAAAQAAASATDPTASVTAIQPASSAPAAQPPTTPPPTPGEELSYQQRLESDGKTGTPAKTASKNEKAKPVADAKAKPLPPQPAPAPAPAEAAPASSTEPAGSGLALRVAAFKERAQADGLAGKLSGKGYATYVVQLPATAKGPGLFSVRVGKFKTRKEADAVKHRLEKEEQLKPSLIQR